MTGPQDRGQGLAEALVDRDALQAAMKDAEALDAR